MDRRTFLGTLAGALLAAPLAAEGQQAGKVWRIGYIDVSDDVKRYEVISQRLRNLGTWRAVISSRSADIQRVRPSAFQSLPLSWFDSGLISSS